MPGTVLGVNETNPSRGAIQYNSRYIDGLILRIQASAGVTKVPVGSIVSWQEDTDGNQILCTGAAAYTGDEYATFAVIGVGYLVPAAQQNGSLAPTPGEYEDGDMAAMVSDIDAVAMVPGVTGSLPDVGATAYVDRAGKLTSSSSNAVAFPGEVFYGVPGIQTAGQLREDYVFARLKQNTI